MHRVKYGILSLATVGAISVGTIGIASAATNHSSSNGDIGSSGIPRTVFKQEQLDAASEVLNTGISNIENAHKDKGFVKLISNAGLTKKSYRQKLKSQLTTDLESKGYSQDQITIALQQKLINHLRHHHK